MYNLWSPKSNLKISYVPRQFAYLEGDKMLPNAINENLPYLKSVLITGNKMLFSDKIEVLSSGELGSTTPATPY